MRWNVSAFMTFTHILTLAVSSPALPAIDLSAFRSSLISGFRGWVTKKKTSVCACKCSAFWLDSHSFVISCIWTQSSLAQLQHGKNANRVCPFCCFASDASLSDAERLLTTLTATDSEIQVLTLAFYPSTWLAAFVFWLIPPDNHLIAHTYS